MSFRRNFMLSLIIFFGPPSILLAQEANIGKFRTEAGTCGQSDLDQLNVVQGGSTITISNAEIFSNQGLQPRSTGLTMPPLTPINCHAISSDNRLILVSSPNRNAFCGWVPSDSIFVSKSKKENTSIFGSPELGGAGSICRTTTELQVRDFCAAASEIGVPPEACENLSNSSIEAKFLTWNAHGSGEKDPLKQLEITLFDSLKEGSKSSKVKIFSILRIFDIAEKDGDFYYLLGVDRQNIIGWAKSSSGTVWYSRLAAFFSPKSNAKIFNREPWDPEAIEIANAPPELKEMLNDKNAFPHYPVLFDNRNQTGIKPKGWKANLQIALLGRECASSFCLLEGEQSADIVPEDLSRADVLFLIDATASMEEYYKLVSQAVKNVVLLEGKNTPDFRFGVAMYGDFLNSKNIGLDDELQFRHAIGLTPIRDGTEFEDLPKQGLYINDFAGGLPEAPFAALKKAIKTAKWNKRKNTPKFVIHIADHGGRKENAPQDLVDLLQDDVVFYFPIAVRGRYDKKASESFVRQANKLVDRHKTPIGQIRIGLPVNKTYQGSAKASPATEYDVIARAIRESISLDINIRRQILAEKLNTSDQALAEDGSPLRPLGAAEFTKAVRELYGLETLDNEKEQVLTLALPGFTITNPYSESGTSDSGPWNYSVRIDPAELRGLREIFGDMCALINGSNGEQLLSDSIKVLLSRLTGDDFRGDRAKFLEYLRDRDSIPISNRTILGKGVLQFASRIGSTTGKEAVNDLRREACRSFLLLDLMPDFKLRKPFETQTFDGKIETGDITWDSKKMVYEPQNIQDHSWLVVDELGTKSYYIPLEYMPQPTSAFSDN